MDTLGLDQIAVEHDIRRRPQPALDQIHQQERQIIEHVARCNTVVELDGVEQYRFVLDQHDVAEVQVAMFWLSR